MTAATGMASNPKPAHFQMLRPGADLAVTGMTLRPQTVAWPRLGQVARWTPSAETVSAMSDAAAPGPAGAARRGLKGQSTGDTTSREGRGSPRKAHAPGDQACHGLRISAAHERGRRRGVGRADRGPLAQPGRGDEFGARPQEPVREYLRRVL